MIDVPGADVVFAPRQRERQAAALYDRSKREGLPASVISQILDDHDRHLIREAEAAGIDTSCLASAWS
ncbi:hypothetical protein ACIOD2_05145 [Amycolatopsis sp. NPDC088138]|uniref:hypothetical protein n=1 Tax=Amycolatopsis sp. NPDC088138 TaxID=3363938 RepID=UPI0038297B40